MFTGSKRPLSILAVDDTPANLVALQAVLEPLGVEVVPAASGLEALDICTRRTFAVVLLDIMMPGIDGFETLARLRKSPSVKPTPPVILLTAFDLDIAMFRRAYALGAVDVLTKPIDTDILLAKLRAFLELHEQADTIRDLAAALETKDRYIGVLAHDLRNPLSTIALAADWLTRHDEGKSRAAAERIGRAAARMDHLIDDVLDFALAAAQKLLPHPSRVDLSKLCSDLVVDFEATHPSVRFTCSVPAETIGSWDVERVQQAVTNLLANAVKYGDGWVHLALEADRAMVHIRVDNGGEPIVADRLPTIFEPFERGTNTGRGLGLGLYIVREIARAHAGDVEVRSTRELTTFCLSLPRETPASE